MTISEEENAFVNVADFAHAIWPSFLPQFDDNSILEGIWFREFETTMEADNVRAKTTLLFDKEIALSIPGVDAIKIVFGAGGGGTIVPVEVGVIPAFYLKILDFPVALRLKSDLFKPAKRIPSSQAGQPDRFGVDTEKEYLEIVLAKVTAQVDDEGNIEVSMDGSIDLPPTMIGDSGIVIEAEDIELYLNTNSPPPGKPAGWRGLHIARAKLYLPSELAGISGSLEITDAYIGNGGFSGTVSNTWTPALHGSFFGMDVTLNSVALTFVQNALTESSIVGTLTLPFFDEPAEIELGIGLNGDLTAILRNTTGGLYTLTKPGILQIKVESLGFKIEDNSFKVILSGDLAPEFGAPDLIWPTFKVDELIIDSDGNVHLEGGWLNLRDQYSLNFYGFQIDLTKLGFGKTEDDGKWVGFSGGLKLVDDLSAGASVEGLRIIWYDDGRPTAITLNGVGVEFEVPEVLRFKGSVSYRELPGGIHRFDGDIKLELISLDLQIDGQLVIGSDEESGFTFFAIYLGTELPAGIPLASTGLGLYGLAGLFALQMEPDKLPDEPWYGIGPGEGWYKRSPIGVADLEKWTNRQDSLGLGAGVTIGTLSDNGFAFSGRMLMVIVFPGPILMIEGKANIVKERSSLNDEPIFRALAVLDNRAGTFLVGVDASYKFGAGGELIDIGAAAEAFFSLSDASAWHLYLGMKDPREKRIRAEVLSLFEANSYFMLDAKQLAMGVWIGYDEHWSFGPLSVTLEAWIDGNAVLSWKPPHFYGDLWLHGKAELSVFRFGLGLSLDARLAVDVFDPFHIVGEFSVGINLPWPLPDYDADITLEWGPELDKPPLPVPLKEIAIEHFKVSTSWPLPRGTLLLPNYDRGDGFLQIPPPSSVETQPPPADLPIVPIDCRPHITFGRAINDDCLVGVNPQPPNPQWERIGDPQRNEGPVQARYALQEVGLDKWNPSVSSWIPVARKAISDNPPGVKVLYGSWAPIPALPGGNVLPGSDPPIANVKLWLWSKTPFDYTRHSGRAWDEWFTDRYSNYPCIPTPPDRIICCNFERLEVGQQIQSPIDCSGKGEVVLEFAEQATVVSLEEPVNGKDHALCYRGRSLEILLFQSAKVVTITLAPNQLTTTNKECISFIVGSDHERPNPFFENDVKFEVYGSQGRLVDSRDLFRGDILGLDCGLETVITLPQPASSVVMSLSSFSAGAQLAAFNAAGSIVASAFMDPADGRTQYIKFDGEGIVKLIVVSPGLAPNETLLHGICYESGSPDSSIVWATGYDADGNAFGPFLAEDNTTIKVEGKNWRRVVVEEERRSEVCIVETCVNFGPDPIEVTEVEKMAQHLVDEMARWSQDGEVLEPNAIYRLKVATRVQAQGEGELSSYSEDLVQTEYAYFQTKGPSGLTALSIPLNYPKPEEFDSGLNDLMRYVKQTIPATVPAVGEKPSLPRPVYRAYDVGVQFNENYVDLMYRIERRDLGLYLFDNNNRSVRDAQGRLIVLANRWGRLEDVTLKESEDLWVKIVNQSNCAILDQSVIPHDRTLTSSEDRQVLDPDAIYEARLVPLLLHEDFGNYTVGDIIVGPSGSLKGWYIHDDGVNQSPSLWRVGETGSPPSRYIEQLSNIWSGSVEAADPAKPGTMLLRANNPDLPDNHPDQPRNWTDYRLSVYMRSTDDDAIGTVFRYQDSNNYYRFSMDRERKYRRLTRIVDGAHTILAEDDFVYRQDQDYLITIEAMGSSLKIYQDGELVFDVVNESLDHGGIGLYCWANAGARFADVRIDDFRSTAPIVYRFKFTTSRYSNFFHYMHSYQDETWRIEITEGSSPTDAEFAEMVALSATPDVPQSDSESLAYESLAEEIFGGQTAGQSPPEVQVTRIERAGNTLAMFIRGPEPIDWKRTSLEVLRTEAPSHTTSIPRILKLTDVSFGVGEPNEESVSVLLREAIDPSRYRIEYRHLPDILKGSTGNSMLFTDNFSGKKRGILFIEEFGPNALNHYTIVDEGANDAPSSWAASEFNITQSSNIYGGSTSPDSLPKPGTMAITGDPSWDSIRISAHLSSTDDDAIGIVFRYKDANNYYRFSMDRKRSYRRLIKKSNDTINMLWEDSFAYNQNQSYHLTIEAYADRIIGYMDNIFIFSIQDDEIRNGMIGFYCWANAGARFEELQVESLEAPPLLWQPLLDNLKELSMVDETGSTGGPSQWIAVDGVLSQSSDIHAPDTSPAKVGTYAVGGSIGWRDIQISVRLRSDDDDAIGVMFRYQDANNYYRFSMDRERSYRRLIKKVGGTVTVLWEDSVQFDIGQDYDLTLYVVGYEIKGHINGAQIFLVQDTDLKRGQVALYCWANKGAHFERLIVIDQTRRIGRWSLRDEGEIGSPSIWKVNNGALHQTSDIFGGSLSGTDPIKPGTYAVAGDITWTDYRLIVQLRSDDDDAIGVIFRYIDDQNYYRFSMDSQHKYRRLVKKVDGVVTTLWEDSNGYTVGELFTLTVDVIGTRLVGYQGDTRLFDILDGSHPSGRIGLYGWANDGMRFENVVVRLPPQEAYAIFRDHFRNMDTTAWTIVDEGTDSAPSNWTTFQGSLRQTSNIYSPPIDRDTLDKQGTQALAGDSSWSDLIITAQLQSFDDDAIGLLFRYSDENHYYRFSMDSQLKYRRLVKKVGSVVTLLWEDGFAYEVGRPYRITIVAVGNILRGYVDGILVFVVKDSDLTSGKIGLYSWANMDARFSDVHVYPSDQLFENWLFDEPFDIIRPDVWNFVDEGDQQGPSHWDVADGALHQTSDIFGGSLSGTDPIKPGTYAVAGDITWTDYRLIVQLRSDDDDAIGVMFRYQDANNYYRFSMDRERSYRRLIKKVGGTVTVLWEDSVQFDIGQDYLLTIDCIGAQLFCYLNGVELFTIKDDELDSGKIGLYSWANTGARFANLRILATSWSTYYEFEEDEGLHPAGTQFKILAGNAANAPSVGSNAVRRFIASIDGHGQIKLPRSGTDLRIMSDRGSQEHVRHFLSEADYSSLSVKVLRKGDGTGFFIFLPAAVPTGSLLPMGQYRLRMTYRRNNSALDPESQVLSQAGINEPESVVLDVPWKTI